MTRVGAAVLAAVVMLFLSACGGDEGSDGVATLDEAAAATSDGEEQEKSVEEQAQEFAACMRENGVDMPDPEVDEDGGLMFQRKGGAVEIDPEAMDKAMKECEDLRPEGGGAVSPEDRAEMEEKMLALAECMRENGVDMPDPDFSKGGAGFRIGGDDADIDMSDPEVQEALETCSADVGMPGPDGQGDGGEE